ncbi:nostrin [Bufo gargarizans]|uniref:nostrin n=1 Tax=Bufo gargarizans TaxID=30331 RepID=UPI001CF1693C|nr:nostrin [Bufo gargarizans]
MDHLFKTRDPFAGSAYEKVYQDLKNISKNGEHFCKTLLSVLQQRADLELNYAKGLEKVSNKLTKALDRMNKNCINTAWACASEEMKTKAEVHRKLGTAIVQEAIKPTNQVLDEHEKKRKKLDNEVDKTASIVLSNWREQIKIKKKLTEHTKKHEALFHHVENENAKESVTEKDKQKLLNKLKKSAAVLTKTDENYYQENLNGQSARLKWESVLENCYKSIQDLEKERIQILSHILTLYNQHVSSYGQTLNACKSQIDQAIISIDVEKDTETFMAETTIYTQENKSEFLLLDYYEEDGSAIMDQNRKINSINEKLARLQSDMEKAIKDREGLEKMMRAYRENPAFSDMKNEEETAALLEETNLRVNLLEANHFKLSSALAQLEQKTLPTHPCSERMTKWREKGCQLCSVQISRSINTIKLRRSQSIRMSTRSYGSSQPPNEYIDPDNIDHPSKPPRSLTKRFSRNSRSSTKEQVGDGQNTEQNIGEWRALYPYTSQRKDELDLEKGDCVIVHRKADDGWWYGTVNGKKGYFPSTYVEEINSST